jgi:flagellar biosynthesis protein FliR
MVLDNGYLQCMMLSAVRITAFLVIAPPFSHNSFPLRIKGMLGLGIGLVVAGRLSTGFTMLDYWPFLVALLVELGAGLALGYLVYLIFAAIQSAGGLVDLFSGFQMAMAFDPGSMVNGAQFTRLFQMTALALLFASDGYQLVIGGLSASFDAIPLGAGFEPAGVVQLMVTAATGMFVAAVQIAGPMIVVLFLADAGLGLLTRIAPALNAFQLGFPLKILITLFLAGTLFLALPRVVAVLADQAARTLLGVG